MSSSAFTIGTGGGSGSGVSLEITINQIGHGLSLGDIIKSNGVDNEFAQAQGDSGPNSEAVGIVSAVVDADNFKYVSSAIQITFGGVPVGTPGSAVFLDPLVPGGMTTTKPTTIGHIVRALGTILASGATMYFDIAALAEEITAASSGFGSNLILLDDTVQSNNCVYTEPIPGGIIGSNGGFRFKLIVDTVGYGSGGGTINYAVTYGGTSFASGTIASGTTSGNGKTSFEGIIYGTGATNAQIGYIEVISQIPTVGGAPNMLSDIATTVMAVDSTILKNLVITFSAVSNATFSFKGVIIQNL